MTENSEKTETRKLSIRQERFCDEFIRIGNATQAYKNAGYADTPNAQANVHRLLRDERVKQVISKLRADLAVKAGITRETEAMEYSLVIETCKGNGDTRGLLRALELRCKLFGLLIDRGITTDTVQERELNEAERIEAKHLAILRLNTKYNKPEAAGKQGSNKAG